MRKNAELRRNNPACSGGNNCSVFGNVTVAERRRACVLGGGRAPGGVFPDPLPPWMICGGFPPVLHHWRRGFLGFNLVSKSVSGE